jgi:hypothetical protein
MKGMGIILGFMAIVFLFSRIHFGLQWQDNKDVKTLKFDYDGAVKYCEDLSLDWHDDWRLPTVKELQTIVDINIKNRPIKSSFKYLAFQGRYWTSNTFAWDEVSYAWSINFYDGDISREYKSDEFFVRCVRGDGEY